MTRHLLVNAGVMIMWLHRGYAAMLENYNLWDKITYYNHLDKNVTMTQCFWKFWKYSNMKILIFEILL